MTPTTLRDLLVQLGNQSGFDVSGEVVLPPREPEYEPMPEDLDSRLGSYLNSNYAKGLYSHQTRAIQSALSGNDVCLATATASGKSLVFTALAVDHLLKDNGAKVLALYPAKALIQDQLMKWKAILNDFGLKVAFIDGTVKPVASRLEIIKSNDVILMTPDIVQAWLMSHLQEPEIRDFLAKLCLVVLDEAHVYDGVFGTNMAYLLRRLQVVANDFRMICCTATLGKPSDFIYQLTGRTTVTFSADDDKSGSPGRTIVLLQPSVADTFQASASFLSALSRANVGKFLAFGDSRKGIELLVAAARRPGKTGADDDDSDSGSEFRLLPYRAGYETEDRNEIQGALRKGLLGGVVATSAMELGIDIGDIDIVVLLGVPPSNKSFWQRLGRGGRKNHGVCLLIDDRNRITGEAAGLPNYLQKEIEPSWLYLGNRYIQYSNALCAANEIMTVGASKEKSTAFDSLPASFGDMLDNEINPKAIVASDLYVLKQRAQGGPHFEFPLRSGVEKDFEIKGQFDKRLGNVSFSQALREAYPGGIYYYMARPYRVAHFNYRDGEIYAKSEKRWITKPIVQAMAFPRFQGGILDLWLCSEGFIAEVEIQVSERVSGFSEQRGSAKPEKHTYGVGSPYYQRELTRFFETTGVCWYFPQTYLRSEEMASLLVEAFCSLFGVQERDLGLGLFYSKLSPLGQEQCQGACIFDGATGSLRLTQRLGQAFGEVVEEAIRIAEDRKQEIEVSRLGELHKFSNELSLAKTPRSPEDSSVAVERDWVEVVAQGERAMYITVAGSEEVVVKDYRFTPDGLMYEIISSRPDVRRFVNLSAVHPLHGQTKQVMYNLYTGEIQALD